MPNADVQQRTRRRRQRQYAHDRLAARWHTDGSVGGQSGDDETRGYSIRERCERRVLGKLLLYQSIVARDISSGCDMVPRTLSQASLSALARIHDDVVDEQPEA